MIAIKHNAFIRYSVVITDDKISFKYKCWLRYNILTVTSIDDEFELNENIDFTTAKKMMFETIKALNKILN